MRKTKENAFWAIGKQGRKCGFTETLKERQDEISDQMAFMGDEEQVHGRPLWGKGISSALVLQGTGRSDIGGGLVGQRPVGKTYTEGENWPSGT